MKSKTVVSGGKERYEERGVSSSKSDVHRAIRKLDKGLFPGAFCRIYPDVLGDDFRYCNIQHADGAGTKSALAYLWWRLSQGRDMRVWRHLIRDSLFMNLDDMGCAGAMGPFLITLTLGRNKVLIPGEVIAELINGCQEVCDLLTSQGIRCVFCGGETADIGDLVRTIVVDNTVTTRFLRTQVIDASRIQSPAYIVGFSSTGQAKWETFPNSGMGANGLTNARHDVLSSAYRQFTETYAPETAEKLIYCGQWALEEQLPGDPHSTIAQALLSPTRTYLPLMSKLFEVVGRGNILGLIHCSGGGQTKIGKFGQYGVHYVKDNLFPIPPLFRFLKEARNLPWREMFTSYNTGHRLEAVVPSQAVADDCIAVSRSCGIDARIIGQVRPGATNERLVTIRTEAGEFDYHFLED